MILEWMEVGESWDEKSDMITFRLNEIWLNVLDGVACLRNVGARFYYNNDEDGSTASLIVDADNQAWITWGGKR